MTHDHHVDPAVDHDGSPADDRQRVDQILGRLRASGGRVTRSRQQVVEVLVEGPGHHLTAPQVLDAVRLIDAQFHESSVYRTLDRLVEIGAVTRIDVSGGSTVYHLPARAHHHLVCDRCGRISGADPDLLAGVADRVRREQGFTLRDEAVTLPGLCRDCASVDGPTHP
ncbi:MAG: Fur family transcriptional regulator [Aquihabitans sp.]